MSSSDEKHKEILKIGMTKVETTTFKIVERKIMARERERERKSQLIRGFALLSLIQKQARDFQ